MIILGIDPGTIAVGYAVIEGAGRAPPRLLAASLLAVHSHEKLVRLVHIHRSIKNVIKKWKPDRVSIEKVFFAKNTKTAFAVSEARGALLLTATLAGITVYEYTPLEIKLAVSGHGTADKTQIKKMIRLIFPAYTENVRDDVFDAIATALTCYFMEK